MLQCVVVCVVVCVRALLPPHCVDAHPDSGVEVCCSVCEGCGPVWSCGCPFELMWCSELWCVAVCVAVCVRAVVPPICMVARHHSDVAVCYAVLRCIAVQCA